MYPKQRNSIFYFEHICLNVRLIKCFILFVEIVPQIYPQNVFCNFETLYKKAEIKS